MSGIIAAGRNPIRAGIARQVWAELLAEYRETLRQRDLVGRLLLLVRLWQRRDELVAVRLRQWRQQARVSDRACW